MLNKLNVLYCNYSFKRLFEQNIDIFFNNNLILFITSVISNKTIV